MFLFFPVSTDAPLYHRPIATGGLIIANCVCFVCTGFGDPALTEPWILKFGSINPLQWLSSMFAHAGFGHIIMNMIFLWAFGHLVEGKLGWRKMLTVYMAIGLTQAALIQLIMINSGLRGALGASSAIMGLMAICLVWAPRNESQVFFVFWFFIILRTGIWDIELMYVAGFYLGWDFLTFSLFDQGMGTAALHLSGAAIGFALGVVYVKRQWVDCENWDLFRVLSGKYGRFADPSTTVGSHADPKLLLGTTADVAVKDDLPDTSLSTRHRKKLEEIVTMIKADDFMGASAELLMIRMEDSGATVSETMLKKLAVGLLQANMPDDAEIYLEEYIDRFPEDCAWARVRMAQILVDLRQRPHAALAMLKQVRKSQLTPSLMQTAVKAGAKAKSQVKAGAEDAEPEW